MFANKVDACVVIESAIFSSFHKACLPFHITDAADSVYDSHIMSMTVFLVIQQLRMIFP